MARRTTSAPTVERELSSGRMQAIEREARALRDQIMSQRRAAFSATDNQFRRDVIIRLRQLLAGEEQPREEDADD